MPIVNHPTHGQIDFPDSMSEREIEEALRKIDGQPASPKPPARQPSRGAWGKAASQAMRGRGNAPQPPQAVMEGMARYGLPVAAGFAAPGIGAAAAAGGIGSLLGDGLAQASEIQRGAREIFSLRDNLAEGALGATPFKPIKAGARVLPALGINVGSAGLTTGTAGALHGDVSAASVGLSTTFTGLLTGIGGRAARMGGRHENLRTVRAERGTGTSALTDVDPKFADLEKRTLAHGSGKASERAKFLTENLDQGIVKDIQQDFPDYVDNAMLTEDMRSAIGVLGPLRKQQRRLREAAEEADRTARLAYESNLPEAGRRATDAGQAAFDAVRAQYVYSAAAADLLGGQTPDMVKVSQGARMKRLIAISKEAKKAAGERIDELYRATGIGINDAVAQRTDIVNRIQGASDGPLAGHHAKADLLAAIEHGFKSPDGERTLEQLSLEGLRKLKGRIASGLTQTHALDPKAANRLAADAYAIVAEAADQFVEATRGPETFNLWQKANSAYAAYVGARGSDAVGMIARGDAAGLHRVILAEGWGPAGEQIETFAKALANTGMLTDDLAKATAKESARLFRRDVNAVIRDGVIHASSEPGSGFAGTAAMDLGKLAGTLQELSSQGFPTERLGLGSKAQIGAIARLARERTFTPDEFSAFIDDVNAVGVKTADARWAYKRALVSGAGVKKMSEARKRAKLTADEADRLVAQAERDPIKILMEGTNLGLSSDPAQNAGFVAKVIKMDPSVVRRYVASASKGVNEHDLMQLDQVRAGAVTGLMQGVVKETASGASLDTNALITFFKATNRKAERESLKALLGEDGFRNLRETFLPRAEGVHRTRRMLDKADDSVDSPLPGGRVVRVKAHLTPNSAGYIPLVEKLNQFINNGRYNAIYRLFIDPVWAPKFRAAGHSVERFANASPVNATMLKLLDVDSGASNPDS